MKPGAATSAAPASPPNVVDLLRQRAATTPDSVAFVHLVDGDHTERALTYGELDLRARAVAAKLTAAGLAGERALLVYAPGPAFLEGFFGCLYAGVVAVPVHPPRAGGAGDNVWAVLRDASPKAVLTTAALHLPVRALFLRTAFRDTPLKWIATDRVSSSLAASWVRGDEPALAFLQYTSGSTSAPKGVMIGHANLLANLALIDEGVRQGPESCAVHWLPMYHDMGLVNMLYPIYKRFPCVLLSPVDMIARPLRWLEAISRYRATYSGGPPFGYELCRRKVGPADISGLDLSSWEVAYVGGEKVRWPAMELFARTFARAGFREKSLFPCYGLAEFTVAVSGGTRGDGATVVEGLVGCGRTKTGHAVAIVHPETGAPLGEGKLGEIWASGPSRAAGYWNRAEESRAVFEARLPDGSGPYLRTGDLGFVKEGQLFVAGRIKELIILRGRNLYPLDVEATVETAHPDLRKGCGAAFSVDGPEGERLVIVQEAGDAPAEGNAVCRAIANAVLEAHEVRPWRVLLVAKGTVPKTSSGKVKRTALRDRFVAGGIEKVLAGWEAPPEEDEPPIPGEPHRDPAWLTGWLVENIAGLLRVPPEQLDPGKPLGQSGLDSLQVMELLGRLETLLGRRLEVDPYFGKKSIREIAELLTHG